MQPFGHNRSGPKIGEGALPPFGEGRAWSASNTKSPGLRHSCIPSGILIMQPFGRNRYGPKIAWGLCPFGGAGSPSNTMWPGPRPTCVPSFILIRPTVWPQCTNVTDRTGQTGQTTDRQRSDSIGRTVLQTVAQKLHYRLLDIRCWFWVRSG